MAKINVYAVKVDFNIDQSLFYQLLNFVSQEKRDRILRFYKREDAVRGLFSDLLARYLIGSQLGIENHQISFGFNEYGKPFLKDHPHFHFNISHSGEWVVCATDHRPLGIDVEMIQPVDFNIAKRFFSQAEYLRLMGKNEPERLSYFFDLWTLKESYLKATSKGLSTDLASFSVINNNDGINIVSTNDSSIYYFKQYTVDVRYKLAVCAQHNNFANEVNLIDWERVVQWFSH